MSIKDNIKKSNFLKKLALWLLMPRNQYRPRLWVKWFWNPFVHQKGRGSVIRWQTRIDVLPFNTFNIGKHTLIEDYSTINNQVGAVEIGDRTLIGISSVIIGPVTIGNNVMLAQHVVMSGLNHRYQNIHQPINQQEVDTDPIIIEDEVWIGANAVITSGTRVGKHAVIAAGSVVTKDVPAYSVVAGNPARIVKQYDPQSEAWININKQNLINEYKA